MASVPTDRAESVVICPAVFPPAAASRIAANLLNRHSAHEIAEAISVLIDVLDLIGGDPDLEDDDPAGQYDEDCYTGPMLPEFGPGCALGDPGGSEESG